MLLTIAQVAERLQCSRGHVHNLINAERDGRDYAGTAGSAPVAAPTECPRPINAAENESAEWCKKNGHCGCVEFEVLRKEYGEAVYPLNPGEGE